MSTDRKLSLAALLVGLLVFGLWLFGGGKTTETIREIVREVVGATPGDQFPELRIGGVKIVGEKQTMLASTTVCSFVSNATSTLDTITIFNKQQFTNDPTWTFSTSTNRATGTVFFAQALPALSGAGISVRPSQAGISSTGASTSQGIILRPNDRVNVSVNATAFNAADDINGTCNFIGYELQ